MTQKTVRFIDLFSGAGGLADGFRSASDEQLKFESVFAVESNRAAAATYERNFGHRVFSRSIERLRKEDLPKASLVIGGPPCQGFSPLGQMSPTDRHLKMNKLWKYFFRVLYWVEPSVFVVENVPEFLKSGEFSLVLKRARALKYQIDFGVLNALDFGVAQSRRRGFLIGYKRGQPILSSGVTSYRRTVRDAIEDLRPLQLRYEFRAERVFQGLPELGGAELHLGRTPTATSLERYRTIPPGGNRFTLMRERPDLTPRCWLQKPSGSTDVMGRLEWDKPALTVRTEFYKPEKGRYLHPEFDRPITHYEAARLQSFPDSFRFCGSKIEIARQIGNAVPPLLARGVAESVRDLFLGRKQLGAPLHWGEQPPLLRLARVV